MSICKLEYVRPVKTQTRIIGSVTLLLASLLLSLTVQAAAVEAELSRVTLFVEGMMKSSGGVT